jgi:hypothetical protein
VRADIDILENEILEHYPDALDILLLDHTTKQNIFWATNNYEHLGNAYNFASPVLPHLVTGDNGHIIMPRVYKDKVLQQNRSKGMAEVFTPSWICNAQNNLIDNAWFDRRDVFNYEILLDTGCRDWEVNQEKITFPNGKTWKDYIKEPRLEMACGEAPYIASRYDSTTGNFILVENRIGILDRKLRVINENVDSTGEWLKAVQTAYKSTYAFEWQGDSLLLAREAMLVTFIENFNKKFGKEPRANSVQFIAYLISWNIWQMDGLKGTIPNSCGTIIKKNLNLFGEFETDSSFCKGCLMNDINSHNGIYCLIKDWSTRDSHEGRLGRKIRFIDLLKI